MSILEVNGLICSHFLCKRKTLFISVNSDYVLNTHCAQYGNADKTDRSAALYRNT